MLANKDFSNIPIGLYIMDDLFLHIKGKNYFHFFYNKDIKINSFYFNESECRNIYIDIKEDDKMHNFVLEYSDKEERDNAINSFIHLNQKFDKFLNYDKEAKAKKGKLAKKYFDDLLKH